MYSLYMPGRTSVNLPSTACLVMSITTSAPRMRSDSPTITRLSGMQMGGRHCVGGSQAGAVVPGGMARLGAEPGATG